MNAMPKSLRDKLGLQPELRTILIDSPKAAASKIDLTATQSMKRLAGAFDYIHFFTTRQYKLRVALPRLKTHLRPNGAVWVSWPKSRQRSTDLTIKDVIKSAYDAGFVESKVVSIDTTWSAIKLTLPKPGKRYANSFGRLPEG